MLLAVYCSEIWDVRDDERVLLSLCLCLGLATGGGGWNGRGILRCKVKVYYMGSSGVSIPFVMFVNFSSLQHLYSDLRIPFYIPI